MSLVPSVPVADNLLAARELMAFTLGFHIVLSCLGVALPAMILIADYIGPAGATTRSRCGLARRWSKAMAVTFAVGAVTGTVLCFEFGPALAALHGALRRRLRDRASRSRGSSSSPRRSSSRSTSTAGSGSSGWAHFWSGVPIVITGIGGAFCVVAANSWMNQPQGFTLDAAGKVVDVEPLKVLFNPADRLRGPAHAPRRLHGRRLRRRLDLRGRRCCSGRARPPAPARAADPAHGRRDR